ncbi:MAG TPA: mechanosensitive ion channel domain-containing protein [Bryobacteraceae bacterium]|nr:mechanosensitive ion channel domain-containing protein [Bryobacteraceae bacterium]
MTRLKNWPALALGLVLVACIAAWYLTRTSSNGVVAKKAPANQGSPVDQRLLETARRIASIARTPDEQAQATEAARLADHELDLAFASSLREAAAPGPPPTGPLKQITDRIAATKARIAADQRAVAKLTKTAASNDAAADQLQLAKAQLALDEDDLDDAQQDLARQGGDEHARLERALQEHEGAQHQPVPLPKAGAAGNNSTLSGQVRSWISLGDDQREIEAARQQAVNHAASLVREHDALEKLLKPAPGASAQAAAPSPETSETAGDEEDTATMLDRLHRISDQRKTLTDLDKRIQDSQQLANVYQRWRGLMDSQRRGVLHLLFGSLIAALAVLLAVLLISRAIRHAFGRFADHKRLHQLRVVAIIGVEVVGVLVVLLIVFGSPGQTSTIIGLATAGLTVALKDFIVAFFGWFSLMGRNGLRVGDWVEINGVSGEVIEIGLLKTVLLEMGNWTSTGHPTGRRVAFVNSFAIEGHYFNFSTAGQWLWDELQVALPSPDDPYQTAQQIRQAIERETEKDAQAAERDWERVTRQYGMRPFSAKPAVDLRPSGGGLNVIVRYITRAPQRYEMKSRLFEAIIALLHKPPSSVAKHS